MHAPVKCIGPLAKWHRYVLYTCKRRPRQTQLRIFLPILTTWLSDTATLHNSAYVWEQFTIWVKTTTPWKRFWMSHPTKKGKCVFLPRDPSYTRWRKDEDVCFSTHHCLQMRASGLICRAAAMSHCCTTHNFQRCLRSVQRWCLVNRQQPALQMSTIEVDYI